MERNDEKLFTSLAEILSLEWTYIGGSPSGNATFEGYWYERFSTLKISTMQDSGGVVDEYERLCWLDGYAPVPHILAHQRKTDYAYLITEAIEGVPVMASRQPLVQRLRQYGQIVRQLHDLPLSAFEPIGVVSPEMQIRAAYEALQSEAQEEAFQQMVRLRPLSASPAVIHGQPRGSNIIVDPSTGELRAFLNVGGVVVADRYTDLAIIMDEIMLTYGTSAWKVFLKAYGLREIIPRKLTFYRLLNKLLSG